MADLTAEGRIVYQQRVRFAELMRRHVSVECAQLSDDDMVRNVFSVYCLYRKQVLIDPSE